MVRQIAKQCFMPYTNNYCQFGHLPLNYHTHQQIRGQARSRSKVNSKPWKGSFTDLLICSWCQPNLPVEPTQPAFVELPVESTKSKSACRANPVCLWSQPNLLLWSQPQPAKPVCGANQICPWNQPNLPVEPTQAAC